MKIILLIAGWISFGLGLMGIILPLLPTTPFLLLATFLFSHSSPSCAKWLKKQNVYKNYVLPIRKGTGLSFKKKVKILVIVALLLVIGALSMESILLKGLMVVIFLTHLYFIGRLPEPKGEYSI